MSSISCCISGARNLRCSGRPSVKGPNAVTAALVGMQRRPFAVEDEDRVRHRRGEIGRGNVFERRLPLSPWRGPARSCRSRGAAPAPQWRRRRQTRSPQSRLDSAPNPQAAIRQAASAASGQRAPNSRPATPRAKLRILGLAGAFSVIRRTRLKATARFPTKPRHCHNFPARPAHRHPIACPRYSGKAR